MDEFYTLLKHYNSDNSNEALPQNWTKIYSESTPPRIYWTVLKEYSKPIIQGTIQFLKLAAGAGNILTLILNLGFQNVVGIEQDLFLTGIANKKLEHFFKREGNSCSWKISDEHFQAKHFNPSKLCLF